LLRYNRQNVHNTPNRLSITGRLATVWEEGLRGFIKNPQRSCLEFSAGFSFVQKGLFATRFGLLIYYFRSNSKKNRHLQEERDKGGNDELGILNGGFLATYTLRKLKISDGNLH